jgi:Tol biopolymer transport system component
MTGHDDFDRALAGWFAADAQSPAPAGDFDHVIDATRRRRPRPAWLAGPGSDWVGDTPAPGTRSRAFPIQRPATPWPSALLLLLVALSLVGGAILVGARLIQPSPPPPGHLGHLAFALDGDIYVADWDGNSRVRIADGAPGGTGECQSFGIEGSIWSPDGRHLAYRSSWGDACRGTVYIDDPEGHTLASFPGTGWLVSWSPDSTKVATWVDWSQTIGVYRIDGVRQALLTLPSGYTVMGDLDPLWSPDGTSLLINLGPASNLSSAGVWELPIDGGAPRQMPADDPRSSYWVGYSRDGARVAVFDISDRVNGNFSSLVVAAADGTERRVLIEAEGGGPRWPPLWSPANDLIAFSWNRDIGSDTAPSDDLRVVDLASGRVTTLASDRSMRPLSFSPEGDRILFSRTDAADVSSLWSVNVDGSNDRLIVGGARWGDWQWLPGDAARETGAP